MRIIVFLLTVCLVAWLAASSPIKPDRQLINRPKIDEFGPRERMSAPSGVKGSRRGVMGLESRNLEKQVTKGGYVCGNKICTLKPGVEPKGCNGDCQYAIS